MYLDDDIVDRRRRLRPLHQPHPSRPSGLIRYHDRFHRNCLLSQLSAVGTCPNAAIERLSAERSLTSAPPSP
jgi:hypothetical protein